MAEQAFLDIGRHCSEDSCRQLDFLPFKCPCCAKPFCGEHWRPPAGHSCPNYDPSLADNRIPSCPLCSAPIPFPPGTDPNLLMDAHLSSCCPTLHPHLAAAPKSKPANECRAPRCKTKMIVPIRCDKCRESFCPKHRFERDHACKGAETAAAASSGGAGVRKLFAGAKGLGKASSSMAGLAALRRAQQAAASKSSSASTTQAAKPSPSTSSSSAATPSIKPSAKRAPLGTSTNPIVVSSDDDSDVQIVSTSSSRPSKAGASSGKKALASVGVGGKVSKRALQEQESARKALEARAKKGLLTEDEKVRYATLQALSASHRKSAGEGCVAS
ncbi:hypothetical protein JCM10213_002640 [Rhodosporidiobolus nylandii]